MIIFQTPHLLFLYFETLCVVSSPTLDDFKVCLIFLGEWGGYRLLLMIFAVSNMFLIL